MVGGAVTRTTISRLTNGWPYLVQVRARNAAGWSDGSGETPATPLAAPATPTGPATSTGTHTVSWGAVRGATTGYKIRERLGAGSWEEYDEGTRRASVSATGGGVIGSTRCRPVTVGAAAPGAAA